MDKEAFNTELIATPLLVVKVTCILEVMTVSNSTIEVYSMMGRTFSTFIIHALLHYQDTVLRRLHRLREPKVKMLA